MKTDRIQLAITLSSFHKYWIPSYLNQRIMMRTRRWRSLGKLFSSSPRFVLDLLAGLSFSLGVSQNIIGCLKRTTFPPRCPLWKIFWRRVYMVKRRLSLWVSPASSPHSWLSLMRFRSLDTLYQPSSRNHPCPSYDEHLLGGMCVELPTSSRGYSP